MPRSVTWPRTSRSPSRAPCATWRRWRRTAWPPWRPPKSTAADAPRLAGLDFEGRVRELAKLATEHGHMAEVVELAGGGLAIRHCHCPIQDVAARTGLPCMNEQQMYERLLGAPVTRSTWMREAAGDCTYEVKGSGGKVG